MYTVTTHPLIDRTGHVSARSTMSPMISSSSNSRRPPGEEPMWPNAQMAAFLQSTSSGEQFSSGSDRMVRANLETWLYISVNVHAY